jgi:hypothetical protein
MRFSGTTDLPIFSTWTAMGIAMWTTLTFTQLYRLKPHALAWRGILEGNYRRKSIL